MTDFDRLPLANIESHFQHWAKVLHHREIGHICFAPLADTYHRSLQFQKWFKTPLPILQLTSELLDDPLSLPPHFSVSPSILIADTLTNTPQIQLLWSTLHSLNPHPSLLIFHQVFPSQLLSSLQNFPTLSRNIAPFPLHTPPTSTKFIQKLAHDWHLTLTPDQVNLLVSECGGYLWLIKEALRQLRDTSTTLENIFKSDVYCWKTLQIWQSLPQEHQMALIYPPTSPTPVIAELTTLGFIDQHHNLPSFLQTHVNQQRQDQFKIDKNQIIFRNVDISATFSLHERHLLGKLWQSHPQPLTRDQIAQAFWGADWSSQYSDWAIDKIISRLRRKIFLHHLPFSIVTHHNLGYGINT